MGYTQGIMIKWIRAFWIFMVIPVATILCFIWFCMGCVLSRLGLPIGRRWIAAAYQRWVAGNSALLCKQSPLLIDEKSLDTLCDQEHWTLIMSNHQSWADILVLQALFAKRLPHLTFVMKESLKWVPIIGLVCMMLDYPFVKRASLNKRKGEAARHDREVLANTFTSLSKTPSTVVTFVEGTRWRPHKVRPPYLRVLPPKASGLAYALTAFSERSPQLLNVTIHYGTSSPSTWAWLFGCYPSIRVDVEKVTPPMPEAHEKAAPYRKRLQPWLADCWKEKDLAMQVFESAAL